MNLFSSPKKKAWLVVFLSFLGLTVSFQNFSLTDPEIYFRSYQLYSPFRFQPSTPGALPKLFLGGWASSGDPAYYFNYLATGYAPNAIYGPDKIWVIDGVTASHDTNQSRLRYSLGVVGYHVNDPTIVRPPSTDGINRSQWLYMYFTMLNNADAYTCTLTSATLDQLAECTAPLHDIGLATSVDEGNTWTYFGIVVHHRAVLNAPVVAPNQNGAWVPSAEVVGNEIYLYFNTGKVNTTGTSSSTAIFRQRLLANGFQAAPPRTVQIIHPILGVINGSVPPLEPVNVYGVANLGNPETPANVDVKKFTLNGNQLLFMVYNGANQKRLFATVARVTKDNQFGAAVPILSTDPAFPTEMLVSPNIINVTWKSGNTYIIDYEVAHILQPTFVAHKRYSKEVTLTPY